MRTSWFLMEERVARAASAHGDAGEKQAMRKLSTEEIGKSYGGAPGGEGGQPGDRAGRGGGAAGAERRGQDDKLLHDRGAGAAGTRAGAGGRPDITRLPMYLRARNYGISYLPQEPSVFRKLTVEENILAVLEAQQLSWEARRHAHGEADRAVESGACAQDAGLCAERRRTAAGGDCAMPGDRAGVHSAG